MHGVFQQWLHHPNIVQNTPLFVLLVIISTILFIALMAGLHRLPPQGKKWLTIICTFLAGLYYLLEYVWPVKIDPQSGQEMNFLTASVSPVGDYITLILIWTLFLGIISLALVHGRRLIARAPGWHNNLGFWLAFLSMIVACFWSGCVPVMNDATVHSILSKFFSTLFDGLLVNFDAAMFALLAFYIASAAYRAFRVRSTESALLMAAAVIVMLGFVNFGVMLTNWIPAHSGWAFFRLEHLASWMLSYVNMPVQRAVTIGVSVGGLAMAMRIWLGLERGSFLEE